MSLKFFIESDTYHDISDDLLSSGDVEIFSVNDDESPVVSTLDINVGSSAPHITDTIQGIYVENDGIKVLRFIPENREKADDDSSYNLKTNMIFKVFEDPLFDQATLLSFIADGLATEYNDTEYTDSSGYPNGSATGKTVKNIQLLWLLKSIFALKGLLLTYEEVKDLIYIAGFEYKYNEYNDPVNETHDLKYSELYVDYAMIFNVNQGIALHPDQLDASNEYSGSKITCWDFIKIICAFFGFAIVHDGPDDEGAGDGYKIVLFENLPALVVADDDNYHQTDSIQVKKSPDYDYNYSCYYMEYIGPILLPANCPYRTAYYVATSPGNLNNTIKRDVVARTQAIVWYNNLFFYALDKRTGHTSTTQLYEAHPIGLKEFTPAHLVNDIIKDKTIIDIVGPMDMTFYKCKTISINVTDRTTAYHMEEPII